MRGHFKFGPLNDPWATWQWHVTVALAPRNLSRRVRRSSKQGDNNRHGCDSGERSEHIVARAFERQVCVYKKNEDGTINKNAVICSFCKKQFSCHRSCSSLTYHLNAEHVGTSSAVSGASPGASATVSTPR